MTDGQHGRMLGLMLGTCATPGCGNAATQLDGDAALCEACALAAARDAEVDDFVTRDTDPAPPPMTSEPPRSYEEQIRDAGRGHLVRDRW